MFVTTLKGSPLVQKHGTPLTVGIVDNFVFGHILNFSE